MSLTVFFIKLLLVHYTTQSNVKASCNQDVTLTCPCPDLENLDFLSVTWYKLNNLKKKRHIRRRKGEHVTNTYGYIRPAEFGKEYSLVLPSVTPNDSGTYECAISANIGGQNRNLQVHLTVDECVTQAQPKTLLNATPTLPCHNQVEDLPVMWSIIGYVAVGFVKILLSIIIIWVIHMTSSKQHQRRW
ncbi:LOW QUALITY PROTEIN: uncharacterized protein LOC121200567 [Toxotes jaculatrix]|uniref:LOW QUALITY PROTEIN: uncharacterized protein LOC121200567 n=1 Tax=Toxotes jaculatrix TaxID=941984 RepID=UPI001B3A9A39|nr:LOW QUALITY PROTEIN: uncharacterized protein LOC121200567 [Toxotes jaculatrix]